MPIRSVESVLTRVQQLAAVDPSPDARAAYGVVLNLFRAVDSCDMDEVQRVSAPLHMTPAEELEFELEVAHDTDFNPDADWRETARRA